MKNPILVPEFREYLSHNNIEALREICEAMAPLIPAALHEARRSRSRLWAALAGVAVWCAGIVAYYLANAAQLAFLGVAGRPELHISNRAAPHFLDNWLATLQMSILAGMVEWLPVAVLGGAAVGFVAALLYLRSRPAFDVAIR